MRTGSSWDTWDAGCDSPMMCTAGAVASFSGRGRTRRNGRATSTGCAEDDTVCEEDCGEDKCVVGAVGTAGEESSADGPSDGMSFKISNSSWRSEPVCLRSERCSCEL